MWLFAIEDSYYKKSFVQLQEEFFTKYPKLQGEILTKKKLKELKLLVENKLKTHTSKLKISFKNKKEFDKEWKSLIDRAQRVDSRLAKRQKDKAGGLEHTYLTIYKYFSEYAHLSMSGIQHFWIQTEKGDSLILDKNPNNITHILVSTYILYLYFAKRLKQYKLIDCSLSKHESFFKKVISKKKIT